MEVLQSNNNLTTFTYDDSNQTSVVSEVLNSTTFKSTYTYDSDKKLTELQDALDYKVGYGYDAFGRLSSKTFKTSLGTALFTTSYTYTGYTEDNVNTTSAQLASITNGSSTISYTYDANGNITAITQGSTVIAYGYDDLGQVVRENNARDNKTIIYDYDLAGNILSRTTYPYTTGSVDGLTPISTLTYSYGKSVWKDQLTAFNGNAITYDDLGNPVEFGKQRYSWEKGRQLSGLTDTNLVVSYTYNDAGIRTSKTVNNVTTTYQLSGDRVTAEITGNQIIYYTYDASGQVVTMSVNGAEYYVVRNGQNDVIALVDNTGAIVVEYTYSTYGEVLTTTGSLSTTIGALNPYRYRGYRYDTESKLYYLQSRYYNPTWGRFINADGIVTASSTLLGTNMYTYCENDPVKKFDHEGTRPHVSSTLLAKQGLVHVTITITEYSKSFRYKYTIDKNGCIAFDFNDNDYFTALKYGHDKMISDEMYRISSTRSLSMKRNSSSQRMRTEVNAHYAAWVVNRATIQNSGIEEAAHDANIGSSDFFDKSYDKDNIVFLAINSAYYGGAHGYIADFGGSLFSRALFWWDFGRKK